MDCSDDILYSKIPLKFRNGSFRVLCVSDIHGGVGYDAENTAADLSALVEGLKPDLVMLLGDIAGPGMIHISNADELKAMLDSLCAPLEKAGIPWAHVFGNHDDNYGLDNSEAEKVYESYAHCVSKAGPAVLGGTGNYVLPVCGRNGKPLFAVYGLDSHRDTEKTFEHSDTLKNAPGGSERGIDTEQVKWYCSVSDRLREISGAPVPALMTFHVPLPEALFMSENAEQCGMTGFCEEEVSCPQINPGLFRAALSQGDIKAFCTGHDHVNTFEGTYCGIKLCSDGYLSYHACHDKRMRGGRIFDIDENNPSAVKTEFVRADAFRKQSDEGLKEVCGFLDKAETYYLATVEMTDSGTPAARVRPFGTADIFEGRLYIQTGREKPVAHQLKENPQIEICAMNEGRWIRIRGSAVLDERIEAQEHMLEKYPSLRSMYTPGDGNTEVYYLDGGMAEISSFGAPKKVIFF